MEKQIKELVLDYQKLIAKMDNKLAVYEQLGTPEEIATKLKISLVAIPESNLSNVVIKKTNALLEAKRNKIVLEKQEVSKQEEITEVISKMPKTSSSPVADMREFLSKFDK